MKKTNNPGFIHLTTVLLIVAVVAVIGVAGVVVISKNSPSADAAVRTGSKVCGSGYTRASVFPQPMYEGKGTKILGYTHLYNNKKKNKLCAYFAVSKSLQGKSRYMYINLYASGHSLKYQDRKIDPTNPDKRYEYYAGPVYVKYTNSWKKLCVVTRAKVAYGGKTHSDKIAPSCFRM